MGDLRTKVYIADVLPLCRPNQLAQYLRLISPERLENAGRLKSMKAKALSVGAEVLLRKALEQSFGMTDQFSLIKGNHGKPILLEHPRIQFNLSHSGSFVVCAVNTQPVGVDIQQMDRMTIQIAKRFFHESEADWLLSLPVGEQKQGACDLWSIKESYMKFTGKGFALDMKAFEVKIKGRFPEYEEVSIFEQEERKNVFMKKYEGPENYVLWCSSTSNQFEDVIEWINL